MAIDNKRHDAILNALVGANYRAAICYSPTSVLLLSGYWPVLGMSVAIFAEDGQVFVVIPQDEMEIAQQSTAAKIIGYEPVSLGSLKDPVRALAEPVGQVMKSLRLSGEIVGVESGQMMQPASYASSANFHAALLNSLMSLQPDTKYVSCDALLDALKRVKTPLELSLICKAADIASDGFYEATAQIRAGMRETEVAAAAYSAFSASRKAGNVGRSYGFFYCMSGPNSAKASAAYARTRQRILEQGDLVMVHANTCADGYWTDITRTYTVGDPTGRQKAMRGAIGRARQAALDVIRPGVAASDVDRAARSVMAEFGFGDAFKHPTGHGVGFAAANANGLPRIHPKSTDILEEGMSFNIEPAAYFDGYGGMRHCDVVAVNADGAAVLTDFQEAFDL